MQDISGAQNLVDALGGKGEAHELDAQSPEQVCVSTHEAPMNSNALVKVP